MKHFFKILIGLLMVSSYTNTLSAQSSNQSQKLEPTQEALVSLASLTAVGDLDNLDRSLHKALDAGLTINEIKEALVHLYAYCGFPRSIRGLQTFMQVLEKRKAKGITDKIGNEASPISKAGNKYERGKKVLGELTKAPQDAAPTGYNAFAPVIDTFLKEHLFADIFERDVLTHAQRELVTIAVISAIGGADPMLRGHLSISLNVGISKSQLLHFVTIIQSTVGKEKAGAAAKVLDEVLCSRQQ